MQPIVDGLEEAYGNRMAFVRLNALDNADGSVLFQQLGLPGHPSFVIFSDDGQQVYTGVGLVQEQQLREEITRLLGDD